MKKSLLALAVLGSFSGLASAQSSVTLFGIVDVNARYIKNGGLDRYLVGTDGNASSRLGVRGVEDLGGGLKAGFWLESQVNPDMGTSNQPDTGVTAAFNTTGRFWHRRATVSLIGGFGEVRLGRDQTPTWTAFADFDVFGTVGVGDAGRTFTLPGTVVVDTRVRTDNAVSYFLPALGGLYGQLTVVPGEGTLGKKYMGGRVGYLAGPLNVTGAYGQTEATTAEDYKVAVVSGSYDFGGFKLLASYMQTKLDLPASIKDTHLTVGGSVKVGAGTIKASYSRTDGKESIATRDANQFAVGYVHDLSKRTAVYGTAAHIKNKGSANFTVQGGGPALAAGGKSSGLDLGIRHSF